MRPFLWVAAIAATPEGLEIGNFFRFLEEAAFVARVSPS